MWAILAIIMMQPFTDSKGGTGWIWQNEFGTTIFEPGGGISRIPNYQIGGRGIPGLGGQPQFGPAPSPSRSGLGSGSIFGEGETREESDGLPTDGDLLGLSPWEKELFDIP